MFINLNSCVLIAILFGLSLSLHQNVISIIHQQSARDSIARSPIPKVRGNALWASLQVGDEIGEGSHEKYISRLKTSFFSTGKENFMRFVCLE